MNQKQAELQAQIPPDYSGPDVEKNILSQLLCSYKAQEALSLCVASGIGIEHFISPLHKHIFDAVMTCASRGIKIDPISVVDTMRGAGVSFDPVYIYNGIADLLPAPSTFPLEVARLLSYHHARLAREFLSTARADLADPYALETTLEELETKIFELRKAGSELQEEVDAGAILNEAWKRVRAGATTGLETGWNAVDEKLCSLTPGSLIYLGGRPGMGKTSLALNIVNHVCCELKKPACFFSLEMASSQIMLRWLSQKSGVPGGLIKRNTLQHQDFNRLLGTIAEINKTRCKVFSGAISDPISIRAQVQRAAVEFKEPVALVVVDYIQLMTTSEKHPDRKSELDAISRSLKLIAGDLGAPILCLSQLSRALEKRADRRPIASDLRDTGSLEQDADCILFVYRDRVYNDQADPQEAELLIAKQRDGEVGKVMLNWNEKTTSFKQW